MILPSPSLSPTTDLHQLQKGSPCLEMRPPLLLQLLISSSCFLFIKPNRSPAFCFMSFISQDHSIPRFWVYQHLTFIEQRLLFLPVTPHCLSKLQDPHFEDPQKPLLIHLFLFRFLPIPFGQPHRPPLAQ